MLSSPSAFAKDIKEPPPPGGQDTDINAKAVLAKNLLTDGIKRYGSNDFTTALKRLNTVVDLDPKNICGFYYRGMTNKKLGKAEAAKKDFKSATALNASSAEEFESRGKAFLESGQKAQGDADLAKAKSLKK